MSKDDDGEIRNVGGEIYDADTGEFLCKAPVDVITPAEVAEADAYAAKPLAEERG